MKKIIYLLLLTLVTANISIQAQITKKNNQSLQDSLSQKLKPISEKDLMLLSKIPELPLPAGFQARSIPYWVDNSTQPYMRPLFNQVGLECGQASGIGLNFTYEIDCKRNVPANVSQNQYPTHFAYDFLNGGGDAGISYYETWDILTHCGTPNVVDYGGMSYGGPSRWMTDYEKYYNGMHNRIAEVYSILANTPEGLTKMKNWIHNHLGQQEIGGVASFYAQYTSPSETLPPGTPCEGKYVITSLGGSPNHAMTIVGYNDSIRWDYNGDGHYTNNIDINGDGVVDMRDWEIGGVKIANTYGGINYWGDQGFSYLMYKTLADDLGSGGIWGHSVNVLDVKTIDNPQLTMKIKIKHTSRNKIKVLPGVSANLSATQPDHILNLPIFNFQGGNLYMQGGSTEADKTIEFGLDITPLLKYINSGETSKFFLQVVEDDPSNEGSGEILQFAVIDYTNGANTINCSTVPTPITPNGITTLSINAAITFDKPVITTDTLPQATVYQPYAYQMESSGGSEPNRWSIKHDYSQTNGTEAFPMINGSQLTLNSKDFVEKDLDFEFPFYGKNYSKVYLHADGYLMFDDQIFPWPYITMESIMFRNTRNISPFMCKVITMNSGDGIWYEGDQNGATFRWKTSIYSQPSTNKVNFAVKIFPSGEIKYYYGDILIPDYEQKNIGISEGDDDNYVWCLSSDSIPPLANRTIDFLPNPYPVEMNISTNGSFNGTPLQPYSNTNIKFAVTDNNFIQVTKVLPFIVKGIMIDYTVNSGGNNIIEYDENPQLTIQLQNMGFDTLTNAVLTLSSPDPYVTLTDSIENVGILATGQTLTLNNALGFHVSGNVPDQYPLNLIITITSQQLTIQRPVSLTAFAPKIQAGQLTIIDGQNGSLDPGETADIVINLKNTGGAKATNLNALLSCVDPNITINSSTFNLDTLYTGTSKNLIFNVTVSANAPIGYNLPLNLAVTADYGYNAMDIVSVIIGLVGENFESGTFQSYDWQFGSDADWVIDNTNFYEGQYSAKSGLIDHAQESSLFLTLNITANGDISFYKKVSCENDPNGTNYDWLGFYIDNNLKNKWDGEVNWSQEVYAVTAGQHTFKWVYHKDGSVSNGSDCGWVDYIVFPPLVPPGRTLSGSIQYPNSAHTPLNNVLLNLKNSSGITVATTLTNQTGNYTFIGLPDGAYTLHPSTTKSWGGVSAADVLLYKKHIAFISSLSGIFLASGDVNVSGDLTASDILIIRKRIATILNSFPSGDWLFNNAPITINGSNVVYNFDGLVYGDANGTFVPSLTKNIENPLPAITDVFKNQPASLLVIEQGKLQGDKIIFPVVANNVNNLGSFQFSINYDPSKFIFAGISDWFSGNESATVGQPEAGKLTFVWTADDQGISLNNTKLFNLIFSPLSGDESSISWSDSPTPREFGDFDGNLFMPNFIDGKAATSIINSEDASIIIYPNPCQGQFTIETIGSMDNIKTVKIRNGVGSLVFEKQNILNKIISVNGLSKGIYAVEIQTANGYFVRKMVVN